TRERTSLLLDVVRNPTTRCIYKFVDLLDERRRGSDLSFAFKTFSPWPYKGALSCSTADLNKAVLESHFLRHVAKEVQSPKPLEMFETGSSVEEVKEDALGILEEMSQNLQLGFIRLMAYMLTKVFKRLFSGIFVNMEGLNMLQQATQESPVILMPNHRSYVDFLAISYILFSYDIPIPVIAAGIPLAGMKIVGEILRRSGAFFIRRAIGSDKLYWAVLSEYIKTIVRKGFAPVEFYVEGLRSRTLKSLVPKLGTKHVGILMLCEVFDITLVPVSISYDRVLEESLLAHELLGVPKPKESTTGLLKASKVLQEAYGSMHVNFGRPLSVRRLCEGKINRCQYNLVPRDLPRKPSAEVQACVSWLAHLTVRVQEEGSVISPWSLMACLLLQAPAAVLSEEGLLWHQLKEKTLWLRKLALDLGAEFQQKHGVRMDNGPRKNPLHFGVDLDKRGSSRNDFEEAIALLKKCGAVHVGQQEVTASDWEVLSFLQTLLRPFIDSYQVLCLLPPLISFVMVHLKAEPSLSAILGLGTYEALSWDVQKNVLSALRRLETLTKLRT
uniref:Phospholipid/glycerol acyltransferase domain-containing protein n=1 Tax=Mola mola TaxID=94237 RepID=A0A3Q4BJQ2_MOLML